MEVELAGMSGPGHVILGFLQVKIPLVEPNAIKFCHIIKIFPAYIIIIINLVMVIMGHNLPITSPDTPRILAHTFEVTRLPRNPVTMSGGPSQDVLQIIFLKT